MRCRAPTMSSMKWAMPCESWKFLVKYTSKFSFHMLFGLALPLTLFLCTLLGTSGVAFGDPSKHLPVSSRSIVSSVIESVTYAEEDSLEEGSLERSLFNRVISFRDDVLESDMDPYLHRLSKKIVLAVLEFKKDGVRHYTRGMNIEASIPTGSVCAERTAIASAQAMFPSIKRSDMTGVAVLQLPFGEKNIESIGDNHINPIWPCGVCSEWLAKIKDVNPDFRTFAFDSPAMTRIMEKSHLEISPEVYASMVSRSMKKKEEESLKTSKSDVSLDQSTEQQSSGNLATTASGTSLSALSGFSSESGAM